MSFDPAESQSGEVSVRFTLGRLLSVLPAFLLLLNGLDQLATFVVGDELAPTLRDQVLVFLEEGTRLDGGLGQTETSSELVVQSVHQLSLLPAR